MAGEVRWPRCASSPGGSAGSRSATLWGTTYGIARLATFRQIPLAVADDADHRAHDAVDALILGWHSRVQHG